MDAHHVGHVRAFGQQARQGRRGRIERVEQPDPPLADLLGQRRHRGRAEPPPPWQRVRDLLHRRAGQVARVRPVGTERRHADQLVHDQPDGGGLQRRAERAERLRARDPSDRQRLAPRLLGAGTAAGAREGGVPRRRTVTRALRRGFVHGAHCTHNLSPEEGNCAVSSRRGPAGQTLVGSPFADDWPDWSAAILAFSSCQSSRVIVHSRAWLPLYAPSRPASAIWSMMRLARL